MKFWTLTLALILAFGGMNAEAKRLGGGRSVGQQSSNVTQRQAAPAAPAQGAAAPAPASPAPAAQPPKRPWGAMLGGLAAGLGLAWLASSLGFGEGFGQFMMIALLVLAAMMLIGWFMRSRRPAPSQTGPFAFQGAGAADAVTAQPYRPENVGNDASARPWERSTAPAPEMKGAGRPSGIVIGSALAGSQNWGIPEGFESEGFINAAKANFVSLQAAWDRADIATLRSMMTDDMLREIQTQLTEREGHTGGTSNRTDVAMLEAQLLGIEDLGGDYMASVEFSGMIREEPSAGPSPFREVWNMTKPKNGSRGWLVAGVQALQ
jgi:predicted lipid-binding transport protein (Tim44 family)